MGHNIGVSKSYYKPSEKDILDDYLKAVDLLTIDNNNSNLEKQVKELSAQNENNEYVIKGKLQEKDEQIQILSEQYNTIQARLESLIMKLDNMHDQEEVDKLASNLFSAGILNTSLKNDIDKEGPII